MSMRDDSATETARATNGTTPPRQPKTIGGFIDDDEEEDDEEYDPVANVQEVEVKAAVNVDRGISSTPQQSVPQSPASAVPSQASSQVAQTQEQPIPSDTVLPTDASPPPSTPQVAGDGNGVQTPVNVPSAPDPSAPVQAVPEAEATSLPNARLPHDRIGMLEDRIKDDPRGDTEAWLLLISEHKKRNKLDEARTVYDRFFAVFPHAVSERMIRTSCNSSCLRKTGGPVGRVHEHGIGAERVLQGRANLQQVIASSAKCTALDHVPELCASQEQPHL